MSENTTNKVRAALDFLGGKTTYLIVAGIILAVYIVSSIIVFATKPSPPTTAATETSAEVTATSEV